MNPINFSELTLFAQKLQRFLTPIGLQGVQSGKAGYTDQVSD